MERILISTNKDRIIDELSEITALMANSHTLNDYLQENLNKSLTKEILIDVLNTGGENIIQQFRNDQEAKLKKAGVIGIAKNHFMASVDHELKNDLLVIKQSFYQEGSINHSPVSVLKYVEFNEKGEPATIEGHEVEIHDKYSIYVSTENHFEVYNAQAEAAKALNKLIEVTKKHLPATTFVNGEAFYGTYFQFNNNTDEVVSKPLNYKSF